jgi:hypothetical protein
MLSLGKGKHGTGAMMYRTMYIVHYSDQYAALHSEALRTCSADRKKFTNYVAIKFAILQRDCTLKSYKHREELAST